MKGYRLIKAFFSCLFLTGYIFCKISYAVTRNEIVQTATAWEYTDSWIPSIDTVNFGTHTFKSNFVIGAGSYDREAYVYGGSDSETQFISRITNSSKCPGGNNIHNPVYNTEWLYKHGYSAEIPSELAGIDCSGFVSSCWNISRTNTVGLASQSVELDSRDDLKPGDILNYQEFHALISLTEPNSGKANIAEAVAPYVRIVNNKDLATYSGSYLPYSPFPIFSDTTFSPCESEVMNDATPEIKINVKSGTSINSTGVKLYIDGSEETNISKTVNSLGNKEYEIICTTTADLPEGQCQWTVSVTNEIGLEDNSAVHNFIIAISSDVTDSEFAGGGFNMTYTDENGWLKTGRSWEKTWGALSSTAVCRYNIPLEEWNWDYPDSTVAEMDISVRLDESGIVTYSAILNSPSRGLRLYNNSANWYSGWRQKVLLPSWMNPEFREVWVNGEKWPEYTDEAEYVEAIQWGDHKGYYWDVQSGAPDTGLTRRGLGRRC